MHFLVTALTSTVTAGSVHQDFSADFTGRRIEVNDPTFQVEQAVHGMENVAQGEIDRSFRRDEPQADFVRLGLGGSHAGQPENGDCAES